MKKFIMITLAVLFILGISGYFAYDYISNKAFNTLINSVADSPSVVQPINSQAPKPDVNESEQPNEEQKQQTGEKNSPSETVPAKENDIISNMSNKKIDSKDKKEALALIYSKLSSAEISMIQSKLQGKLTSEDIKEIKALVKSRFSQQDIDKIMYWYNKYR